MPRSRSTVAVLLLVPLLGLLGGCGDTAPPKLVPSQPAVPQDLCSLLPASVVGSLQTSSDSDQTGNPTSVCSLSSQVGASPAVRSTVTITQFSDEDSATAAFDSQCRALDAGTATVTADLPVQGADKACGSQSKASDQSTLAALHGLDVLTARSSSTPAGNPSALARGTAMLQAVLSGSSAAPSSPTPSS
jgi:hypothetical protein